MDVFLESNPGLASRFSGTVDFEDFGNDELVTVFERFAIERGYQALDTEMSEALLSYFKHLERDAKFGNARTARKLFDATVARHAARAMSREASDETLTKLNAGDLPRE